MDATLEARIEAVEQTLGAARLIEPVTVSGWYELNDGRTARFEWMEGRARCVEIRANAQRRVITYEGEKTISRLVAAGLGKATVAATPHGQLPAIEVSEEVWRAYLEAPKGRDLADYLLERFR